MRFGGVRKCVAVLMTDLRGFTAMTEEADSAQLVAQLNEYFTEMVKCVFAADGTLDKFVGDAILAVWGNVHSGGKALDAEMAVDHRAAHAGEPAGAERRAGRRAAGPR